MDGHELSNNSIYLDLVCIWYIAFTKCMKTELSSFFHLVRMQIIKMNHIKSMMSKLSSLYYTGGFKINLICEQSETKIMTNFNYCTDC